MKKAAVILLYGFAFSCTGVTVPSKVNNDSAATTVQKTGTLVKDKTLDSVDNANAEIIKNDGGHIQKAIVFRKDSIIWLTANIKIDHRIFGYESAGTSSRKMILISIFTGDVEGNPFKCPFGAYYQSSDMVNINLKFISVEGPFAKVRVIKDGKPVGIVYIENKWLEFEK